MQLTSEVLWNGCLASLGVLVVTVAITFGTMRDTATKRRFAQLSGITSAMASLASLTYSGKALAGLVGPGSGMSVRGWPLPWIADDSQALVFCAPLVLGDLAFWGMLAWVSLVFLDAVVKRLKLLNWVEPLNFATMGALVVIAATTPLWLSALLGR